MIICVHEVSEQSSESEVIFVDYGALTDKNYKKAIDEALKSKYAHDQITHENSFTYGDLDETPLRTLPCVVDKSIKLFIEG